MGTVTYLKTPRRQRGHLVLAGLVDALREIHAAGISLVRLLVGVFLGFAVLLVVFLSALLHWLPER